jgi:hypothetical protein
MEVFTKTQGLASLTAELKRGPLQIEDNPSTAIHLALGHSHGMYDCGLDCCRTVGRQHGVYGGGCDSGTRLQKPYSSFANCVLQPLIGTISVGTLVIWPGLNFMP